MSSLPPIKLDYISLVGSQLSVDSSNTIAQFLGVPYAAPPINTLRFKPPQPPIDQSGQDPLIATEYENSCIPYTGASESSSISTSEDCLYLNIFAPADALTNASAKYPVVVYIHGGKYISGSPANPIYNGTNFIAAAPQNQKVIVVTFSYRLAYFGFMASSDLQAEGSLNAGLLDQVAAFKWVQKYIAKFGGDPTRITAWGESAGAHSIHYHMVAVPPPPFTSAIMQSGAVDINTGYVSMFQYSYYNAIATALNCPNPSKYLSCLRSASTTDFIAAAKKTPSLYLPVIDGTYLSQSGISLALGGKTHSVSALWMDATDEGTTFAYYGNAQLNDSMALAFEKSSFYFLNSSAVDKFTALYPPSQYSSVGPYSRDFEAAADAYGDAIYKCPTHVSAVAAVQSHPQIPIYRARFNIIPSILPVPNAQQNLGVFHAADAPFTWNYQRLLAANESRVAAALVSAFTSFIYGNPPATSPGNVWPAFTGASNLQWVVIDANISNRLVAPSSNFLMKCQFWVDAALAYNGTNPAANNWPTSSNTLQSYPINISLHVLCLLFILTLLLR